MKKLIVPLASVVLVLGLTTGSALAKGTSDLSSDISTAAQSGQVQIQETGTTGERQVSEPWKAPSSRRLSRLRRPSSRLNLLNRVRQLTERYGGRDVRPFFFGCVRLSL